MRDGSTRILLEHRRRTRCRPRSSIRPSGPDAAPRPLGAEAADYLGYAFLVRPARRPPIRAPSRPATCRSDHWFWSVVGRFWSNYSHVALAAFIVNMLALASPLFIMNVYDRVVPNGAIPSLVALAIGLDHRDRVRFRAADRAQPHHRHDRQEDRRRARRQYLRARPGREDGASGRARSASSPIRCAISIRCASSSPPAPWCRRPICCSRSSSSPCCSSSPDRWPGSRSRCCR